MTIDEFLDGLLIASIILSTCLLLIAMAGLGRRLADWELQAERKITGVSRIQAAIAIRGQVGTVLLAFVFVTINIMLLIESPQIARMWVNRVAWTLLLTLLLVHAVVDWMAERKQVRLLIAEEDALHEQLVAAVRAAGQGSRESPAAPSAPDPLASVDVASIQPEAVEMIADAVQEHHEGKAR
jgi:hypothetical protein